MADAILMDHITVSDKAQFQLCGEVNKQNHQSMFAPWKTTT
jgi:hypothetical protein